MTNSGRFPEAPPDVTDGTIDINKRGQKMTITATIKAPILKEIRIGRYQLILVKTGQINFKGGK